MKAGPRSLDPVWGVMPKAAQARARRALKALDKLPVSRQFGTATGLSMARAIAAGKEVDMRKVSHFFPRWRRRIEVREAAKLTPMDDKIVGASDLWGGPAGDRASLRAVERVDRARAKKKTRKVVSIG